MALPAAGPDRTCVVTGASSGIGAEIARELARRHLGVTLVARREELLRALADELSSAHGVRAEVLGADLTDADARAAIPAAVEARGLIVDVLVNNAGFSTTGPVERSDHAREVAMLRTNVEAVADLCSLLVPGMVARHTGAVLNVASTAAFQPLPGQAGYAASKSFVLSYTQALRAELRGTGVTATALCPGPVETGFVEVSGLSDEEAEGAVPKFMWVSAGAVARAAVGGMASGRAVVIPGAANRIAAAAAHMTPRKVLLPILARQHPSLKR
ncbi:MAG: SDR family NAD(P)-dependent oxidoreductase [Acidimicrobiales bacterium]